MACVVTKKQHELVVIQTRQVGMELHVVRWCKDCGGVVIDVDVDNRTDPGVIAMMRFPTLAGQAKLDIQTRQASQVATPLSGG